MRRRRYRTLIALALLTAGCPGHPFEALEPYRVVSITIDQKAQEIRVGETLALSATWTLQNGDERSADGPLLDWSSSAPRVATVQSDGVASGIGPGTTVITVRVGESGPSAKTTLRVVP